MREMFDAGDDVGPSPFDALELGVAAADDEEDDDEDDELDETAPRVVMGTLDDLGTGAPASVARTADRPIWFIRDEHADLVGLFERYPEAASPSSTPVLAFLRAFSTDHGAELQVLLGPTERLRYGFHISASLEEVVESFEDDGFDVLLGIRDGQVELPDAGLEVGGGMAGLV